MKKWQIGWGPIVSCNMKCKFCYSENSRKNTQSLSYQDWVSFIDNNYKYIDAINYGTGENTMSDEWFKLVKHIREQYPNIAQALTTNGYLSERIMEDSEYDEIIKKSINEVDVSLDFSAPMKHNEFRGQKHAYRWAINTLEYLKDKDIETTIVFLGSPETLEKENIKGLFEIGKKYNAKLRMNIYRPTNGINDASKRFIPSFEQIIDTLYYINNNYRIVAICDPLFSSILTEDNYEEDPSGSNSLRILGDGSITPSTYLISEEFKRANIKMLDALKVIENDNLFNDVILAPIPKECEQCQYVNTCKGGVYDRRYLWYGDFNERDPYCPFRNSQSIKFEKVKVKRDNDFSSIHDGYLPTMFFNC
ncbi:radical SAM/SPASM domain-containing protein [Paramaledivibacter caminithermalis]|jgi:radical SAM protein with 4Fe4S-binding SPASM domain|uniref:Radical SAM additional 4Fe4S-binding SPASM domain-containing protein n=1 Tax=Paramaledivibacter caminithermalis (strain DSM 15212 / CIP 107654 / DViRD3) TaxID=1121301 RepID=A0A1M6QFH6_PARC5|nr:radical SAM protein [Paramaledivibacter caminithermalis]SHK19054.1 radical SAM additional 4Fe4S-binding SPASM domain-containing protein [Paramaledivibacter caminithermalis DSM 15212]